MHKPPKKSKGPTKQKPEGKKRDTEKKKYRVRNWREYNEALVNRGRVLFWITEEALEQWKEQQEEGAKRKRGKPRTFSNMAIETALTVREVFRLPLRQTEGFLVSILHRIGATVKVPDYSTLSIRAGTLPVAIRVRPLRDERLHVVVDSTGAKVFGEGEWKVRQHGWSKRRRWKKLHIGVDEQTGDILLGEVTDNDTADCEMLKPLLEQLPVSVAIDQVSADGAYDTRMCYEPLTTRGVSRISIPPRRRARIWRHGNTKGGRLPRDENLRRIRAIGTKRWKREIGYHRRSLVETTMFRSKMVFGDKVRSRITPSQRTELLLRCRALNLMTTLGMPESYVVA